MFDRIPTNFAVLRFIPPCSAPCPPHLTPPLTLKKISHPLRFKLWSIMVSWYHGLRFNMSKQNDCSRTFVQYVLTIFRQNDMFKQKLWSIMVSSIRCLSRTIVQHVLIIFRCQPAICVVEFTAQFALIFCPLRSRHAQATPSWQHRRGGGRTFGI